MALTQHTVKGKLSPIGNRVIVKNMHFGEQTTAGGISFVLCAPVQRQALHV